jgi:hypothetical protein
LSFELVKSEPSSSILYCKAPITSRICKNGAFPYLNSRLILFFLSAAEKESVKKGVI